MIRRLALFSSAIVLGSVAFGASALAHIHPDPSEAQAGDTVTVGFTVEHGCDGSPTTQIEMRLADGVVDAAPEPLDGWDASIDDDVVTFAGGPLDADTEATFEITMTLPTTPDITIYFPFVQRCEVGEIRWIGIPDQSGDELDEPAPAMDLIGPAITAPAPPATEPVASPVTTEASPATTAVDVTTPVDSTPVTSEPAASDTDGSSDTGTIIFIISVLAVFLVGGIAWFAARRARAGGEPGEPADDDTTAGSTE